MALWVSTVFSQQDPPDQKKFHGGQGSPDTLAGYAQVVLVEHVLYLSGVVAAGSSMEEQLKGVYEGIGRCLAH